MTLATTNLRIGVDCNRPEPRSGYTMVEVLLVLAVITAIGAIAWPQLKNSFEISKLKSAAEQVQTAFTHARIEAINKGVPQVFRFEEGTGHYTIAVWQDDSATTESDAAASTDATVTARTEATAAAAAAADSTSIGEHQLPEGMIFSGGDRVLDIRAAAVESAIDSTEAIKSLTPPLLFYPDGTTSEAVVTLASPSGRSISVSLCGWTGVAKLGDVVQGQAPGGKAP